MSFYPAKIKRGRGSYYGGNADWWNQGDWSVWLGSVGWNFCYYNSWAEDDGGLSPPVDVILYNVIGFDVKAWDPGAHL